MNNKIDTFFEKYHVDRQTGLKSSQIPLMKERYGANELDKQQKESLIQVFISEMKDPLVLILLVSTMISGLMGEFIDAFIMIVVVLINASIGMAQKLKAEKALESLKQMNLPTCECFRDGHWQTIKASDLVVGDIIDLKTGMYVPADVYLFDNVSIQIDESVLTGESVAIMKEDGDKAYMSTSVTYGKAKGLVFAVGMATEIGKIAAVLKQKDEQKTPLQKNLQKLSEKLGLLALMVCLCMFIVGVVQGRDFFDMLLLSISLAVAAIPEGLVAVVSIVLALGTSKMAKQKAVVRHLHAIETLGCVSIICSDKTGTLTQNEMRVVDVFSFNDNGRLAKGMLLANNTYEADGILVGDATEKALTRHFIRYENIEVLRELYPRLSEIPFDSKSKKMQVIVKEDDHYTAYEKGALEVILPQCDRVLVDGVVTLLDEKLKAKIMETQRGMSEKALRVLSLAYQPLTSVSTKVSEMIFVGLVGMMDPCRPEVKPALEACRKAGIKVTMITGDNPDTAFAIAKELQLTQYRKQVVTSKDLAEIDDKTLSRQVENIRVVARAKPNDKVRIVEALKKQHHIVAMSGDGVNDAPALKKAHVGVAMGLTGTDVAKGAADVILMDDHFKTIVDAIRQGRQIYVNIRQTIWYLLSCNLGEIMTLFVGMLLLSEMSVVLTPVMILWINLVTDAFPALCLGMMKSGDDLMQDPPRDPNESLFAHGGLVFMVTNGALIGILSLVAYRYGLELSSGHASTMAFMVLSIAQLTHTLNFISMKHSLMKVDFKPYRLLLGVVFALILLQVACVHFAPLSWLLKTTPLDYTCWGVVTGLCLCPIAYNELVKWLTH